MTNELDFGIGEAREFGIDYYVEKDLSTRDAVVDSTTLYLRLGKKIGATKSETVIKSCCLCT